MNEISLFLAEIKIFLARHDMPKTTLGIKALGDPSFYRRVVVDKLYQPKPKTIAKVRTWMATYNRRKGYGY